MAMNTGTLQENQLDYEGSEITSKRDGQTELWQYKPGKKINVTLVHSVFKDLSHERWNRVRTSGGLGIHT